MRRNGPIALAFHTLFVMFIAAPLVAVALVSFTDKAYLSMPFDGASLRWYVALLNEPAFLSALQTSIVLGAISATIAIVLAVPAALALTRAQFAGKEAINAALLSPLLIPHVVLGVAFLRFFSGLGLYGNFGALVAAHVVIVLPYALRLTVATSSGMDVKLEQAAASLGARPWVIFRRVTLPVILPGVVSGWILAFLQSFDELTMTAFLSSPSTVTLPVRLYLHIEETIDPLVASVSTVLIVGALALMAVLDRIYGLDNIFIGKR
ncbi:ABC transporter permease [Stappia sp.]|uniref:ABC transporter permease n=1 Tax=Stappia sp. TaxID=1870903 RepID=UPI003A994E22